MTIKDLVKDKKNVYIEYRTDSPYEKNILAGSCHWDGEKLQPVDGDEYSLNDEVARWVWENDKNLIIWYESKWI